MGTVNKILDNFWLLLLYRIIVPILMIVAYFVENETLFAVLITLLIPLVLGAVGMVFFIIIVTMFDFKD
jgi:hypothetical protein